tara:strand:- start:150 stop:449 length:300 start_codon:yes stop_codon:yes gene_type:complete
VHDPDEVLTYDRENFDASILKFLGDIHPREDLLSFENKITNYIVDFGYYGCELALDGTWVVYVVNGNINEPWEQPVERHETDAFLEGIDNVDIMLQKYT